MGAGGERCVLRSHGGTHLNRVPGVVSHFVQEFAPPSHEHSKSEPVPQSWPQAPPDGGGDGASPICHFSKSLLSHVYQMSFCELATVKQSSLPLLS